MTKHRGLSRDIALELRSAHAHGSDCQINSLTNRLTKTRHDRDIVKKVYCVCTSCGGQTTQNNVKRIQKQFIFQSNIDTHSTRRAI